MEKLNICKTEQQRICWKNGRVLALENWTLMEGCKEQVFRSLSEFKHESFQ